MTSYRCVNDPFSYCSTAPAHLPEPYDTSGHGSFILTGGLCRKNPAKCRTFVTNTQLCLKNPPETKKRRTRMDATASKRKK